MIGISLVPGTVKPSLGGPYHEAAADIWLEDLVEGALGEGTAVEREDPGDVAQAVVVVSAALYRHRGLSVVGVGLVLSRTRRAEYAAEW